MISTPRYSKPRARKITEEQVRAMHARAIAGEGTPSLARELGVSSWALQKRIRQLGLELRGKSEALRLANDRRRKVSDDDVRALHERHLAGESIIGMAREVGISSRALSARCLRLGLKIRGRAEAARVHADRRRAAA